MVFLTKFFHFTPFRGKRLSTLFYKNVIIKWCRLKIVTLGTGRRPLSIVTVADLKVACNEYAKYTCKSATYCDTHDLTV